MIKKLQITCDEATTICDKSQYNEASFFEKIKLNLHLIRCKICGLYVKQNRKMTALFKAKSLACKDETNCLSNRDKKELKKELEQMSI